MRKPDRATALACWKHLAGMDGETPPDGMGRDLWRWLVATAGDIAAADAVEDSRRRPDALMHAVGLTGKITPHAREIAAAVFSGETWARYRGEVVIEHSGRDRDRQSREWVRAAVPALRRRADIPDGALTRRINEALRASRRNSPD